MAEKIGEKITTAKSSIKNIDQRGSHLEDITNEERKKELKMRLNVKLKTLHDTLDLIREEIESMLLRDDYNEGEYKKFKGEYNILKKQYQDLADGDFMLHEKLEYKTEKEKGVAKRINTMYKQEGYKQLLDAFFKSKTPQILDNSKGKSTEHIDNLNPVSIDLFWNNFYNIYKQSPNGFQKYINNQFSQDMNRYHGLLNKLEEKFNKTKIEMHLDKDEVYYGYALEGRLMVSSDARNTTREKVPPSYKKTGNSNSGGQPRTNPFEGSEGNTGKGSEGGKWPETNPFEGPEGNTGKGSEGNMGTKERKEWEQFIDFKNFEDCQNTCAFTEAPKDSGFDVIIFKKEGNKLIGYPIIIGKSQNDLIKKATEHERAKKTTGTYIREGINKTMDFIASLTNNLVLTATNIRASANIIKSPVTGP